MVNFAATLKDKYITKKLPKPSVYLKKTDTIQEKEIIRPQKVKPNYSPSLSPSDPRGPKKFSMSKQSTFKDAEELPDDDNDDGVNEEWPEGAVGMKEDKFEEIKGDKKRIRIRRRYKMEDGSIFTKEFSTVERVH